MQKGTKRTITTTKTYASLKSKNFFLTPPLSQKPSNGTMMATSKNGPSSSTEKASRSPNTSTTKNTTPSKKPSLQTSVATVQNKATLLNTPTQMMHTTSLHLFESQTASPKPTPICLIQTSPPPKLYRTARFLFATSMNTAGTTS